MTLRLAIGVVLVCGCRLNFDDFTPGLAPVEGIGVSSPGALALEDGRYDISRSLDGAGYALAWAEYPKGAQRASVMFTEVGENLETIVAPTTIEIVDSTVRGVQLWRGPTTYLLVIHRPNDSVVHILDVEGRSLSRRTTSFDGLAVAPQSDRFVIVTRESPSGYPNVAIGTLELDGTEQAPRTIVDPASTDQLQMQAATVGDEVVVVWRDTSKKQIHYVRSDRTGQPISAPATLFDTGVEQGNPLIAPDRAGGFVVAWDGNNRLPAYAMRFAGDGTPLWPAPAQIYSAARYHFTLDISAHETGAVAFAWVTGIEETVLTSVELAVVDGRSSTTPAVPAPQLLSDPTYSFCYPEVEHASSTFGTVFVGTVNGTKTLFLALTRL